MCVCFGGGEGLGFKNKAVSTKDSLNHKEERGKGWDWKGEHLDVHMYD